jgi:hypothetical protein
VCELVDGNQMLLFWLNTPELEGKELKKEFNIALLR